MPAFSPLPLYLTFCFARDWGEVPIIIAIKLEALIEKRGHALCRNCIMFHKKIFKPRRNPWITKKRCASKTSAIGLGGKVYWLDKRDIKLTDLEPLGLHRIQHQAQHSDHVHWLCLAQNDKVKKNY